MTLSVDLGERRALVDGAEVRLTAFEFRLLAALATAAPVAVSRPALLRAIGYRDASMVDTRTIDAHIGRLRAKLGRGVLLTPIPGYGYRLDGSVGVTRQPDAARLVEPVRCPHCDRPLTLTLGAGAENALPSVP